MLLSRLCQQRPQRLPGSGGMPEVEGLGLCWSRERSRDAAPTPGAAPPILGAATPTTGVAPPPPRDSVRPALRLAARWAPSSGRLPEPEGAGAGWRRGSAAAGAGPGEDRKLGRSSRAQGHCRGAGTGRCRRITFQGVCSSSFPPAISRGHFMD